VACGCLAIICRMSVSEAINVGIHGCTPEPKKSNMEKKTLKTPINVGLLFIQEKCNNYGNLQTSQYSR
jgi:hypothetical protein